MYCYSNQELYEQREVTLKECQTVQPSVVESHFQQNSEYGQKAGFRYVFTTGQSLTKIWTQAIIAHSLN